MITQLAKETFLSDDAVNARTLRAKELYPDPSFFRTYYIGTTYVSLEDAMQTQKEVGSEKLVRRTWDAEDNNRIRNDVWL